MMRNKTLKKNIKMKLISSTLSGKKRWKSIIMKVKTWRSSW